MSKSKHRHNRHPSRPIAIQIDSVAPVKMAALLAAANAQEALCRALGSACTVVNVTDNTFIGAPRQSGPALSVSTMD